MWLSNVASNLSNSPSANSLLKLPEFLDPSARTSQNTNVTGEQYIRTLSHYIRSNERRLTSHQGSPLPSGHRRADSGSGSGSFSISNLWSISAALTGSYLKSAIPAAQIPSPTGSNSSLPKTILLTFDHHHLYFLLSKFAEYGYDVGAFEVDPEYESQGDPKNLLETSSITSTTSVNSISSAMSSLSLFSGWQGWSIGAQQNEVPIEDDIRYIYRTLLKLSGLKLSILTHTKIEAPDGWSPLARMISLAPFKSLAHLEIYRLPIKMIDGWDILQEKLEILIVQNGTIDDIHELFVDVVVESMKKRKDKKTKKRIQAEEEELKPSSKESKNALEEPAVSILPPKIWPRLTNINLSHNALTFVANEPVSFITTCTHLDLSNNLLIAVPIALAHLYNLEYLNLSYNMIESILGIYEILRNVNKLELRNNRIENLCGLERVFTLEYVDVRENRLTDWAEIGRMTELSGLKDIFVEGNPFTQYQPNYRVNIFTVYKANNIDVNLDGSGPSMKERRYIYITPSTPDGSQRAPIASLSKALSSESLFGPNSDGSMASIDIPGLVKKGRKSRSRRVVDPLEDHGGIEVLSESGIDNVSVRSGRIIRPKKKKETLKSSSPSKNESSETKRPVHRTIEVTKAAAHDSGLRKKKSKTHINRSKKLETPPISPPLGASNVSDSEVLYSPLSGSPPGDGYKDRMMNLRKEGGSAWLRVLNEMEYSPNNENNKLRERNMKNFLGHVSSEEKKDLERH
ncbi:hypothetical protein G9A89_006833 [Geosiphon pyriformis]|nr:hypothetical protein G9A89_006833 [Geosiphon pyriformis]